MKHYLLGLLIALVATPLMAESQKPYAYHKRAELATSLFVDYDNEFNAEIEVGVNEQSTIAFAYVKDEDVSIFDTEEGECMAISYRFYNGFFPTQKRGRKYYRLREYVGIGIGYTKTETTTFIQQLFGKTESGNDNKEYIGPYAEGGIKISMTNYIGLMAKAGIIYTPGDDKVTLISLFGATIGIP